MNRLLISEREVVNRGFSKKLILQIFILTFPYLVVQTVGKTGPLSVQNILFLNLSFVQSLLDLRNDVELFLFLLSFVGKN